MAFTYISLAISTYLQGDKGTERSSYQRAWRGSGDGHLKKAWRLKRERVLSLHEQDRGFRKKRAAGGGGEEATHRVPFVFLFILHTGSHFKVGFSGLFF